jgi:hypothetical protein
MVCLRCDTSNLGYWVQNGRKLVGWRQGSPMFRMNLRAFVLRSSRWNTCAVCRTTQTRSSSTQDCR